VKERIQWISAALLLVTIATLLLTISAEEGQDAPRVMGLTLIFTALFVAIYAPDIHFRRLHLLTNGLPYAYADHNGPVILTAAIVMDIIRFLCYAFTVAPNEGEASSWTGSVATADSSGKFIRYNFTGISLLEYEPSDVLLDGMRQMLVVPSHSKLTGLALNIQG